MSGYARKSVSTAAMAAAITASQAAQDVTLATTAGAGQVGTSPLVNYVKGTLGYDNRLRVHVKSFAGVTGNGVADDTAGLQAALTMMSVVTRGGGILECEGGRYRITGKLTVPTFVLLRGASWLPDPSNLAHPYHTAIYVDFGAGSAPGSGNHAIELSHSAGIEGFTFFYPGQVAKTATTPVSFDYAISTPIGAGPYDNLHVSNITFYNAFAGLRLVNAGRWRVSDLQGDPLAIGIFADQCWDVCYLDRVHFWGFYTQSNTLESWVVANGTAYDFRRIDQLLADKLFSWNRNIGFACGAGLWANLSGILIDRANYPFVVDQVAQLSVDGFVLIANGTVRPTIWGKSVTSSARFANGRITSAASVGAQVDSGTFLFDNVDFDSPHAAVVNTSATAEVRVSDTCRWNVPPLGTYSTWVNGERLPKADTPIALPAPSPTGATAITGGWRFPLDAVGTSLLDWDVTAIGQRCGLHILEFDYKLVGSTPTTWYFKFQVCKDSGGTTVAAYAPLAPLILNTPAGGTVRVRIPFYLNHVRYRTVARILVEVTAGTPGASLEVTNVVLSDQSSRTMTDNQISNLIRAGYCLDPNLKGQTTYTKGLARRIYTQPEPGIGRTGATPTAGAWEVGDEVLLDAPAAASSPGVICTTAGDFAGTPPIFRPLPAIA